MILSPCYILTPYSRLPLLSSFYSTSHLFVTDTEINLLLYIHQIIESFLHIAPITDFYFLSLHNCKFLFFGYCLSYSLQFAVVSYILKCYVTLDAG